MNSLQKLLEFIVNNWSQIVVIATLILTIAANIQKFIKDWKAKSSEEKQREFEKAVETAKKALADYILILVSKAEIDWQSEGGKLGQIRRAQVIEKIYEKYPVLEAVENKDELLTYIDKLINESLETVRKELRTEEIKDGNS